MKKHVSILVLALLAVCTVSAQDTIRSLQAGEWKKTLKKDVIYTLEPNGNSIDFKEEATLLHAVEMPVNLVFCSTAKPIIDTIDEGIIIKGAKWATRNVAMPGTFAPKPEDAGMFYQWNRKVGWSSADPLVNSNGGYEWNSSNATGDSWASANDPCPTGWRVPTKAEWEGLISAGSNWNSDKKGRFFGSVEPKLFFSAAGSRSGGGGTLINVGYFGFYWSATPHESNFAYDMEFDSLAISNSVTGRNYAFQVRCVDATFDPETHDEGIIINGVKWATRNVAAHGKFVATPEDHGALFQWGRKGDGHEQRTSPNYPTNDNSGENGMVSGDENFDANGQIINTHDAYGKFIKQNDNPWDWRSPQIKTLWNSGSDEFPIKTENDPCPVGWRMPTQEELGNLVEKKLNWDPVQKGYYFGNVEEKIFMPAAGGRWNDEGTMFSVGTLGYYWSSTVKNDTLVHDLHFSSGGVDVLNTQRAYGFSVRCVDATYAETHDEGIIIKGAKWATRNVALPGKFTQKPEDAGMFYQWNRKVGWSSEDPLVNSNGGTSWDSSTPTGDSWEQENDPCPTGWRVPTKAEFESLISEGSNWDSDKKGRFFGSVYKAFFPAAGSRNGGGGLTHVGTYGDYWSATPDENEYAYSLSFTGGNCYTTYSNCNNGYPVRCVDATFDPETQDEGIIINGVKWATRNVAAHGKFVATPEEYGALFQWGRKGDGHEQRTSPNYPTNDNSGENGMVSGDENFDANGQIINTHAAYGKFIKQSKMPYDWRSPQLNTLWNSGTETAPVKTANDPCPIGWRLPTVTELQSLLAAGSEWDNLKGGLVFGTAPNQIFLPAAHQRIFTSGEMGNTGTYGYYWSSTFYGTLARGLAFFTWSAGTYSGDSARGLSVRCVAE